MPVSQGSAGGLPGMNLKAWILVSAAGVKLKSFNVGTPSIVQTGKMSFPFTQPMAGTDYLAKFTPSFGTNGAYFGTLTSRTVNTGQGTVGYIGAAGAFTPESTAGLWEFYE